jgi:hypothetical protein
VRASMAVLVLAISAVLVAQAPLAVGKLMISSPASIATIDMDKLKGEPSRLAWSPDATELYLQTIEGGFGKPDAKLRHYLFSATTGAKKDLQAEPEWVSPYWTAKSNQASPDVPGLKIALESEQRLQRATSAPMGGDLARGGVDTGGTGGTSAGDVANAAASSQTVTVHSMRLNGQTIGEFVNSVIVPGLTFAWAPQGAQAIAFSALSSGRIVIMDPKGTKQDVDGSKDAVLPAWSPDASRLAWLQRDGKKKFALHVAQVGV